LREEIAMGLDIRIPLGLMFLVTGGLMAVYGLFTRGSAIYDKSLDMNINLIWGALMFVFGLVMYILGRRPRRLVAARVERTDQSLK
jgi:hypothetical protein